MGQAVAEKAAGLVVFAGASATSQLGVWTSNLHGGSRSILRSDGSWHTAVDRAPAVRAEALPVLGLEGGRVVVGRVVVVKVVARAAA